GPGVPLEPADTGTAVARLCGGRAAGASRTQCRACLFYQRSAVSPRAVAVAWADDPALPHATPGAVAWPLALRPDAMAVAECAGPGMALAADGGAGEGG